MTAPSMTIVRARVADLRRSSMAPALVGPFAALWAAGIGLAVAVVPMLVVWMASPASGLTWLDALRIAGLMWSVANGAAITVGAVTVTLLPWGLTLIPLFLLGYAGGWSARRCRIATPRDCGLLIVSGALVYGILVAVVAAFASQAVAYVSVPLAAVGGFVIGLVGLGWGALRASGLGDRLAGRLPGAALVVRAGLVGALVIAGFGAVAVTASLIVHVDDAITMAQSLHGGPWGGLGLLVLGLGYAPVAALWGAAYVTGAGVVLAPAVTVSPFILVTAPTQLPPFPLLAALPQQAAPIAWALPLTGVVAGVLAGLMIGRRARTEPRLVRLVYACGAATVTGLVLAAATVAASGSLGDLRLAAVGPLPLTVGVLVAVLVVLGAAPSAVVPAPPERPRLAVANPEQSKLSPDSVVAETP